MVNHQMVNHLFIDIETIPCQEDTLSGLLVENIKPRANLKDPDKIQADIAEKMTSTVAQTALDGTFGEVCCIGYAIDNDPVQTISRSHDEEAELLEIWMDRMSLATSFTSHPMWVGHNIGFDLRFLWQRFIIHGLNMPVSIPYDAKPWSTGIYDTLWHWAGSDLRNHGLDMLSKVFLLPPKPFDSKDVGDLWTTRRYDDIAALCKHDVANVRELYRRMSRNVDIEPF